MRISSFFLAAAAAGILMPGLASAQFRPPASPASYDYYQPQTEASPSDVAPVPVEEEAEPAPQPVPVPVTAAAGSCDAACDGACAGACDTAGPAACDGACGGGCVSCCDSGCGGWLPCHTGEAWSLFDHIMGPCHDTDLDIGGWIQTGYHTYNTGMFNNYPDTVQLHQAWGYIGKEADGSCGLDFGFRFDYVYGTDGPDTQAFGNPPNGNWDENWDAGNFYGHAIPQLYGEVAYGDLSVKVGHFYTIAGYEVVQATGNFFYSHAFTMYNAEPFTHTGALATYNLNDNVTLYGGWTKGWDTGFDTWGGDNFLGGISVQLTEDVALTYTNTFGKIGFGTNATGYSHSIVLDVTLTERLNWVVLSDYVDYNGDDAFGAAPGRAAEFHRYSVVNYLFYEINDCLQAGARFEWFNAEDNTFFTPGVDDPNRSDVYGITFGLNYKPCPNFIVRPEVRWDLDDDGFIVPAADNDQLGFGVDAILTF